MYRALEKGDGLLLLCIWFPMSPNPFSHHCHALRYVLGVQKSNMNISDALISLSGLQVRNTDIAWEFVKWKLKATCNALTYTSQKESMGSTQNTFSFLYKYSPNQEQPLSHTYVVIK